MICSSFSQVVAHNGFSGAAHALGMVPSRIPRRIAQLEERLGVRLVQRSTRSFAVTDLGKEFNKHCLNMIAGATAALEEVARSRARRHPGLIRISCPSMLLQMVIGPLLPLFLEKNPDVRIAIETTNRKVNIEENFDLSIRVRQLPCEDSGVVVRSLGIVQKVLVASRTLLDRRGATDHAGRADAAAQYEFSLAAGPSCVDRCKSRRLRITNSARSGPDRRRFAPHPAGCRTRCWACAAASVDVFGRYPTGEPRTRPTRLLGTAV